MRARVTKVLSLNRPVYRPSELPQALTASINSRCRAAPLPLNINEGYHAVGQCNGKAERGRESLWTPGTGPLSRAITKLSMPVWAMAGTDSG